jgi:diadenosine tetraphosphatase ApaH/serine/threonine PP2A family protein phosphatase
MKRVAAFGDVHGRLDLLIELYKKLEWESLDEIRHSGDLIDRGPDSSGVVSFCREKGIAGVMGNHESTMLERYINKGQTPQSKDKLRTFTQLMNGPKEDIEYLRTLPYLHIDDEIKTAFVHGGLYPFRPFHAQPIPNISFLGMIRPFDTPGETRWFTKDKKGRLEEENRKEGWVRWYEAWDGEYRVVFGHSVFRYQPMIHKPGPGIGECIGVDTGAVWSGQLTAVILPDLRFVSTPLTREFTVPEGTKLKPEDYGFHED